MSTLSQFFPGGAGDGLLLFSKELAWNGIYASFDSAEYVNTTYIGFLDAPGGAPNGRIQLLQSGNYILKVYGGILPDLTNNADAHFTLQNSGLSTIKTRKEHLGGAGHSSLPNITNNELLFDVNANDNFYMAFFGPATTFHLKLEVYKR